MIWDYGERNPCAGELISTRAIESILAHLVKLPPVEALPQVQQGSATQLQLLYPDNFFDAVLTDPPYYINVPYADLSDFFYIWLKRTIGDLYPELFATPLTPKSEEICQMKHWDPERYAHKTKDWFEAKLTEAFSEIHRVLKPEGIGVIVFAYPRAEAWEAVIKAILNANLYLTASWPIHTEMQARLRAQESAALASSIYMVCRKRTTHEVGEYPAVQNEIEARVQQRLAQFWEAGIRGADFFMSAIGPAVEAFGRYARVKRRSGEGDVTVAELLEYVRQVVSKFALERILQSGQLGKEVDEATRFYLVYRWAYNHARVPFNEACKLAYFVGVELPTLWGPGELVEKQKDYVRLPMPLEHARHSALAKKTHFETMIDALHYALWLWAQNEHERLNKHLSDTYGAQEAFWQVAQAIAEVLPEGDKEKQLLQGLLYRRRGYRPNQQLELRL